MLFLEIIQPHKDAGENHWILPKGIKDESRWHL